MKDRTLFTAALVMLTGVALGAFGAHGLKGKVTAEALSQWQTGVLYQLVHGLALFGTIACDGRVSARRLRWVRAFFIAGALFFCGSLYLLATRDLLGISGWTAVLGPMTPLGGSGFIAGWSVLAYSALTRR